MAEDDKSDLRQLSQCLNQASSLIEAILKHPEHCSSSSQSTSTERTPVTPNERQREFGNNTYDTNNQFPRRSTESVNRPSSGEASTMKSQPAPGSQLQVREPGAGSRFDLNLELE